MQHRETHTTVSTFPPEMTTVVRFQDATSSKPTTVINSGPEVATVVRFQDATSSKPTAVTQIRRTASVRRLEARATSQREVWFYWSKTSVFVTWDPLGALLGSIFDDFSVSFLGPFPGPLRDRFWIDFGSILENF